MQRNGIIPAVVTVATLASVVTVQIVSGGVPAELWTVLSVAIGGFFGATIPAGPDQGRHADTTTR